MASFVKHEPCPECGSRNNLGRYDDGSAHCFGCAYWEPAKHAPPRRLKEKQKHEEESSIPKMPDDTGTNYSTEAIAWLAQYCVSVEDAIKAGFRWSGSRKQLIFLLEDGCWQARNFSISGTNEAKRSKYFTAGNVNDSIKCYLSDNTLKAPDIAGQQDVGVSAAVRSTAPLAIVEDCVSAFRISSWCDAMPILGSHVAKTKLSRLARLYSSLIIWLDHDKLKEARILSYQAQLLGLSTKVIYTEDDPKCYEPTALKDILNNA